MARRKTALALDLTHPVVFVADVHLGHSPDVSERFRTFLDALPRETTIVSLGDIVDIWAEGLAWDLGERYPVLDLLRERKVFYLPGNRDFLMGDRWRARFGGRILPDPIEFRLGNRRLVGTHGDLLLTADRRYQIWRGLCRSRTFKHVSGLLGPNLAMRLAGGLRKKSLREIARKSTATLALDREEAARFLGGRDLLVAGHVHRAERSTLETGELVVLGAWNEGGEILLLTENDLWFGSPEEMPIVQQGAMQQGAKHTL